MSEDTICIVLLEDEYSWQEACSWCQTEQVTCKRGKFIVTDEDVMAKKNLIENPYRTGEKLGLAV